MVKELIVEQLKTRLDKYLASQMPGLSRSLIQRDHSQRQAQR